MTAGVLSVLGLKFGPTVGPSRYNRKGYFENENVRANVLKPLIRRAGGDTYGQRKFPDPTVGDPAELREAVLEHLDGATAYKDAKITLMWDVWARAFPDSLYVIVRRDPEDVARSCMHTKFMFAFATMEKWKEWAIAYRDRYLQLAERVESIEIWPDGTADIYKPVAEFAGLEWNQEAVDEFVDPTLWNQHKR